MMWTLWPLGVGHVYRSIIKVLILRVDDDGPRDLIVPALLAAVDSDPQESEVQRKCREEVREQPHDKAQGARRAAIFRVDDLQSQRDLARRRAAIPPEADHRRADDQRHEQVP